MTRSLQKHTFGAIYYVVLRGNSDHWLFHDDSDRSHFIDLVSAVTRRHFARVHAYCLAPWEVRILVEVSHIPVGVLVQRIATPHARWVNDKMGVHGSLFQEHYRSILLDREKHLLSTVRHIHRTPIEIGLVQDLREYPWSSHPVYLGTRPAQWVTTRLVGAALEENPKGCVQAYNELMKTDGPDAIAVEGRDKQYSPEERPGEAVFVEQIRAGKDERALTVSLDDLVDGVCRRLQVRRDQVLSNCRARRLSRARALIAWHATRNELASLRHVSRHLNRDPSTLYVGYERYRREQPELFAEPLHMLLSSMTHRLLKPDLTPVKPRADSDPRRNSWPSAERHRCRRASSDDAGARQRAHRFNVRRKPTVGIIRDPAVMSGIPVLAGTRIPIQVMFTYFIEGASLTDFLRDFPFVSRTLALKTLKQIEELSLASVPLMH